MIVRDVLTRKSTSLASPNHKKWGVEKILVEEWCLVEGWWTENAEGPLGQSSERASAHHVIGLLGDDKVAPLPERLRLRRRDAPEASDPAAQPTNIKSLLMRRAVAGKKSHTYGKNCGAHRMY